MEKINLQKLLINGDILFPPIEIKEDCYFVFIELYCNNLLITKERFLYSPDKFTKNTFIHLPPTSPRQILKQNFNKFNKQDIWIKFSYENSQNLF